MEEEPNLNRGIRRVPWVSAGVALVMFCWLGFVSYKIDPVFQGFEDRLPGMTRLSLAYGPVAFPLFGVLAVIGLFLTSGLRWPKWIRGSFMVLVLILGLAIFKSLIFPGGFFLWPLLESSEETNGLRK